MVLRRRLFSFFLLFLSALPQALNAQIASIQRIIYGYSLIDSLARNQFPRGGTYTAIVSGSGLKTVTGFVSSNPNVTGTVSSATDTAVTVQISSTPVKENNTVDAPIPGVSFALLLPSGSIGSGAVTFDIVIGPPTQITSFKVSNNVKWIPAGVATTVTYSVTALGAGNNQFWYIGCGQCFGSFGTFTGDQFSVSFSLTTVVTATKDFANTTFSVVVGGVDGSGQGGTTGTDPLSPKTLKLPIVQTQLVDPVADNPATTLLNGPTVTDDTTLLADQSRGRIVKGIAADGVAQLLIRIAGAPPNESFSFNVAEGTIANIGLSPSFQSSSISVNADSSGIGFVLYKSPIDFARATTDNAVSRVVDLTYSSPDNNPSVIAGDSPITLVRPPVVLVHGNWSNSTRDWQFFQFAASPTPVQIYRADYSAFLDKGVAAAASSVLPQVQQMIEAFKQGALTADGSTVPVAAVQADLVAYSLGGVVSRALVKRRFFANAFNYSTGYVHKLITMDTPHLGSELATALIRSNGACQTLFATFVGPVSQNIKDMVPNSPLLTILATPSPSGIHLPTAVIASNANASQEGAADTTYFNSVLYQLPGNIPGPCRKLLPAGGYAALFAASGFPGGSDLIVSTRSQLATGLGLGGSVPGTIFSGSLGAVHDVNPALFPIGPDVRQSNLVGRTLVGVAPPFPSTEQVLQLMNTPISSFQRIAP